jgi:hypothetical protein
VKEHELRLPELACLQLQEHELQRPNLALPLPRGARAPAPRATLPATLSGSRTEAKRFAVEAQASDPPCGFPAVLPIYNLDPSQGIPRGGCRYPCAPLPVLLLRRVHRSQRLHWCAQGRLPQRGRGARILDNQWWCFGVHHEENLRMYYTTPSVYKYKMF